MGRSFANDKSTYSFYHTGEERTRLVRSELMRRSTAAVVSVDRFFELALLGLVSSGYLAVVGSGYLDAPTAVLTALGLLLRGLLVAGLVRFELSSRLVGVATFAYIGFYPLDYAFISREFLPATVHLVFFLAVMKVLTGRRGTTCSSR